MNALVVVVAVVVLPLAMSAALAVAVAAASKVTAAEEWAAGMVAGEAGEVLLSSHTVVVVGDTPTAAATLEVAAAVMATHPVVLALLPGGKRLPTHFRRQIQLWHNIARLLLLLLASRLDDGFFTSSATPHTLTLT